MRTTNSSFSPNGLVVFAEYDSGLVACDVLGTHMRMHWNVFFAVPVMGVLVVAHDVLLVLATRVRRRWVRWCVIGLDSWSSKNVVVGGSSQEDLV